MENNLDVWNSHVHCYETSQIIKQIRVIVLHGNRGMVLCCYHRMTDLRSYPLWFSSTAERQKEMVCLSWSCRKKTPPTTTKETAFLGGTNWRRWITGWSVSLLIQPVLKAEASFADICAHVDAESQDQTKGCYTQNTWTCLPHEVQNSKSKRANLPSAEDGC